MVVVNLPAELAGTPENSDLAHYGGATVVQENGVQEESDAKAENATDNSDKGTSGNSTSIVSIGGSSITTITSKASGSKRKVEARGDERNDNKIGTSSSEDSPAQVPHVSTLPRPAFAVGTKLLKFFSIPYEGKVVKLPTEEDDTYYRVEYEDGDVEDYELHELNALAKMYNAKNTGRKVAIGMGTKVMKNFDIPFEGKVVKVLLRGTPKYRIKYLLDGDTELLTASALKPLVEAFVNSVKDSSDGNSASSIEML